MALTVYELPTMGVAGGVDVKLIDWVAREAITTDLVSVPARKSGVGGVAASMTHVPKPVNVTVFPDNVQPVDVTSRLNVTVPPLAAEALTLYEPPTTGLAGGVENVIWLAT
jgi:hypothetical protein